MKKEIWNMARNLAKSELRLNFLQTAQAPSVIIKDEEKRLQGKINKILASKHSEHVLKALPLAKDFETKLQARRDTMESDTFLEKFGNLLMAWFQDQNYPIEGEFNQTEREVCESLKKAITNGRKRKIVSTLIVITNYFRSDWIYTELPPMPEPPDFDD